MADTMSRLSDKEVCDEARNSDAELDVVAMSAEDWPDRIKRYLVKGEFSLLLDQGFSTKV